MPRKQRTKREFKAPEAAVKLGEIIFHNHHKHKRALEVVVVRKLAAERAKQEFDEVAELIAEYEKLGGLWEDSKGLHNQLIGE